VFRATTASLFPSIQLLGVETPRPTYYRSGIELPLIRHRLPLFSRGRFGFVISGSAPDSSKSQLVQEYKFCCVDAPATAPGHFLSADLPVCPI
jgi:hypothetical protein